MSKKISFWDTEDGILLLCVLIPAALVLTPILLIMLVQVIMTGKVNWG